MTYAVAGAQIAEVQRAGRMDDGGDFARGGCGVGGGVGDWWGRYPRWGGGQVDKRP